MIRSGNWFLTLVSPTELICDSMSIGQQPVTIDVGSATSPEADLKDLGALCLKLYSELHLPAGETSPICSWIERAAATFDWPNSE